MGVLLMLAASACFATMSAFVKAIGTRIPPVEMVFLRSLIATPILGIIVLSRRQPLIVHARGTLLMRTLFGMTAMIGFFFALTHMPLADCIFLGRSQPLILALLAPIVVKETAPPSAWIAIVLGLSGVILIMRPGMEWQAAAWVMLASAAGSAMAHLMVRRLGGTDTPLVIVFNFSALTTVLTSAWALRRFVMPTPAEWGMIAMVALLASLAQLSMTLAYRMDRAPVIASASYSSVVLAVLFGYIFWGEIPHPLAWVGGLFIILGGIILVSLRWHADEPPSPAAT